MRTLARIALDPPASGEPLPTVFRSLYDFGIRPRRGAVFMIAAPPGAMKTFLALKWVQAMRLTTLFFSADTDANTILERAGAVITGDRQEDVRLGLEEGGGEYYAKKLREFAGHVRWVFESDPTYHDIELEITAFAEVYGQFPEVIVVDNLMNVTGENESEWAAMRDSAKVLHRITRITGAAVFVLHHMSENKADERYPAPRKDLQGKVAQLPELIVSVSIDSDEGLIRVADVKDRWGRADPSAKSFATVHIDPERGQFFNTGYDKQIGMAI